MCCKQKSPTAPSYKTEILPLHRAYYYTKIELKYRFQTERCYASYYSLRHRVSFPICMGTVHESIKEIQSKIYRMKRDKYY